MAPPTPERMANYPSRIAMKGDIKELLLSGADGVDTILVGTLPSIEQTCAAQISMTGNSCTSNLRTAISFCLLRLEQRLNFA